MSEGKNGENKKGTKVSLYTVLATFFGDEPSK